VNRQHDRGLER